MKFIRKNKKDKTKKKEIVDKIMGIRTLAEAYRKLKRTKQINKTANIETPN